MGWSSNSRAVATPNSAAAAPNTPEEVGVRTGAGSQEPTRCGDKIDREQVVARETVFPSESAHAAASVSPARRLHPIFLSSEANSAAFL